MRHSLADVARRANVSQATASRVVSNSTYPVSPEIRERVLAAASELDYTPSALARALATRHSRLLSVIVGDVVDPYFAEIARGVEDVARASGHLTFVCNADGDTAAELRYVQLLGEYRAEGIIFAGGGDDGDRDAAALAAAVTEAAAAGVRMVSLAPRSFETTAVTIDNRGAMTDATSHLVTLGHRRIAYLEGPAGLSTSIERASGFCDAMRAAGLDASCRYPGRFDYESGRRAAAAMVVDGLPDGVVASSDIAAIGLLTGLREAGVGVPGEVSIVGIDDIAVARFMDLTTVRVPMHDLGATAARVVLDGDGSSAPQRIVLPHELVVRGSTRPHPTAAVTAATRSAPPPPATATHLPSTQEIRP